MKKNRILITASLALGDTVMFMPVLRILHNNCYESQLDIVLEHSLPAPTLNRTGFFKHIYILDNRLFSIRKLPFFKRLVFAFVYTIRHIVKLIRILVATAFRYDMVLGHYNSCLPDLALITLFSGASRRIGPLRLKTNRFPYTLIYSESYKHDESIHFQVSNYDLLKRLKIQYNNIESWWPVFRQEQIYAEQIISSLRDSDVSCIAVSPSVGYFKWKQWSSELFTRLIELLIEDLSIAVILVGGPEDSNFFPIAENENRIINLIGKTTVDESAAILAQVDCVICNDSGVGHLAGALGTPVISIFGPTDPFLTSPLNHMQTVMNPDASLCTCAPCFKNDNEQEPAQCLNRKCLSSIKPEQVFSEVMTFMKEKNVSIKH